MSPPKKDPLVGKRLREYVILDLIGKGGMAKVYKARHCLLDEVRAIKFLRPELRERQECIARFQREARIMVRLRHKHLVLLHEFGTVGNELFFLVMEYLEGESLRERLRRNSWIPTAEAIRVVQQVALGLVEAHSEPSVTPQRGSVEPFGQQPVQALRGFRPACGEVAKLLRIRTQVVELGPRGANVFEIGCPKAQ